MLKKVRQTRLEINLDNIEYNMEQLKNLVGDTKILGVIKSDAYSNGAVNVARTIMDSGAYALAVATLNEAMELRNQGILDPILILGFTEKCAFDLVVDNNITQTIYNLEQARILNKEAMKKKTRAKIHIKIDTGMSRLGFSPIDKNIEIIEKIYKMPFIELEGIFSHFAESEVEDQTFSRLQYKKFIDFLDQLEGRGMHFKIRHISNWGGAIEFPEFNLDMVRLGVPIFGVYSNYKLQKPKIDLRLTMKFRTAVSNIKLLHKGDSISYNRQFICNKDTLVATLPVGYADGFYQEIADQTGVYINGQRARVLGKVCMDQTMVDITHIANVKMSSEAIIFGDESQEFLSARCISTIARRVPRVYFKNGQILKVVDYLKY